MNVFPHPGPTGFGILVTNPNGMSVIDWARTLLRAVDRAISMRGLAEAGAGPGHVFADPGFTPAPPCRGDPGLVARCPASPWPRPRIDIVRALLEGIACEFSLTLDVLRAHGITPRLVRATGGGLESAWWLQLKADVTGVPVEVVDQDEPGAFGAAILAGVGSACIPSVSAAVEPTGQRRPPVRAGSPSAARAMPARRRR